MQSGCNNQKKFRKPQLSCVKCNDREECAFGQDPTAAIACEKDVVFGDVETCFTLTNNSNVDSIFNNNFSVSVVKMFLNLNFRNK